MRARLGVRINDGKTDRFVSRDTTGLKIRRTASGGFHSASAKINVGRGEFTDLGAADKLYVYSPKGKTLWEGFTDNPGYTDGPEGQSLDLSAMGTTVLAGDQAMALVYVDGDFSQWEQNASAATSATASSGGDPTSATGDEAGLTCQFNPGQPVGTGNVAAIGYRGFTNAGWQFGSARVSLKSGVIDANYRNAMAYVGGNSDLNSGITTSVTTGSRANGDAGHPPSGSAAIALHIRRTGGATNVTTDNVWTWFHEVHMCGRRMNRTGTLLTGIAGMVAYDYVRADWVVEDLVGRLLTICDPYSVTIDATTWQIDQLAYHDAVTAAQVLDDLTLWEPDFLWEFLESTPRGYRFNYRAWPTTARYEISTRDSYNAPGGDVDLCNRIAVKWTDPKGKPRTTVVTATSATYPALKALEDAGRTRDAEPVTLPEGRGSTANAQRIGEQVLASKVNPPKAANAVVDRPILDLLRGCWVMPYEIEPGYVVRVRETGDMLRLTEMEYDDDSGSTALTLGTPVLSIEQRVARLANVA